MVEILYPKLDRAVIITLLNLDKYYSNTIFNNIVYNLDKGNIAYILMSEKNETILSAVIFCDEETSKKYLNITYAYWISIEILKRDSEKYTTEKIVYREGIELSDESINLKIVKHVIKTSKDVLNRIYAATLQNTNVIYVHKANMMLRTPVLYEYGKYIAGFNKYGKIYGVFTVDSSEKISAILKEANSYNDQIQVCKDDKYIDIKFLTYIGMERSI